MSAEFVDVTAIDPQGDADAGFELQLHHPDNVDQKLDIWVTVTGQDGTAFTTTQTAQRRRAIEEAVNPDGPVVDPETDDEKADRQYLELAVACTKGWRGMGWEGQALEFNPRNAAMIYQQRRWIRNQVENAVLRRANFKRG